jgi:hypothetical protein
MPPGYSDALFRLQVDAARRYLFDTELKEALEEAAIPLDVLNITGTQQPLTVAQVAIFSQVLRDITGDDKAVEYGHEAFIRCTSLIPRAANLPPVLRAVSSADKLFLRIREAMANFNRKTGQNVMVKWHGGAESDIFDDTAQACYGYIADAAICYTMTGFLEEAINNLSGVKVKLTEVECMARGAGSCRWHAALV